MIQENATSAEWLLLFKKINRWTLKFAQALSLCFMAELSISPTANARSRRRSCQIRLEARRRAASSVARRLTEKTSVTAARVESALALIKLNKRVNEGFIGSFTVAHAAEALSMSLLTESEIIALVRAGRVTTGERGAVFDPPGPEVLAALHTELYGYMFDESRAVALLGSLRLDAANPIANGVMSYEDLMGSGVSNGEAFARLRGGHVRLPVAASPEVITPMINERHLRTDLDPRHSLEINFTGPRIYEVPARDYAEDVLDRIEPSSLRNLVLIGWPALKDRKVIRILPLLRQALEALTPGGSLIVGHFHRDEVPRLDALERAAGMLDLDIEPVKHENFEGRRLRVKSIR